jgi:hypothetical protein
MADNHRVSRRTAREISGYRAKLDKRRHARDRVDAMLINYWSSLIAESEQLAEAVAERAFREAALRGTLLSDRDCDRRSYGSIDSLQLALGESSTFNGRVR